MQAKSLELSDLYNHAVERKSEFTPLSLLFPLLPPGSGFRAPLPEKRTFDCNIYLKQGHYVLMQFCTSATIHEWNYYCVMCIGFDAVYEPLPGTRFSIIMIDIKVL